MGQLGTNLRNQFQQSLNLIVEETTTNQDRVAAEDDLGEWRDLVEVPPGHWGVRWPVGWGQGVGGSGWCCGVIVSNRFERAEVSFNRELLATTWIG